MSKKLLVISEIGVYLYWINNIFCYYENCIAKKRCYLIMDKALSHVEKNIIKDLKNKKIIYSLMPVGMTRFLQPLDIGINKIFKNYMKEEYIRYISNIMNNNVEDIEYKYNYSPEITNLSKLDIERRNIIKWCIKYGMIMN